MLFRSVLPDPTGYGRIVRDESGAVVSIVEHKDASEQQRSISEINSGMYVFAVDALRTALTQVTRDNAQGEEYLTDVLQIQRTLNLRVAAFPVADGYEIAGVNDRVQLADAAAVMRQRINAAWMREGVSIIDPATTWIEADVVLARPPAVHTAGEHLKCALLRRFDDDLLADGLCAHDFAPGLSCSTAARKLSRASSHMRSR